MGLRLPINGYYLPRGRKRLRGDEQSAWNTKTRRKIGQFIEAMHHANRETHIFHSGTGSETWQGLLYMEYEMEERRSLRRLLDRIGSPATLVIPHRDDILETETMDFAREILERQIAVIPLNWESLAPYWANEDWNIAAAEEALRNALRFRTQMERTMCAHDSARSLETH
jgi:hypothetical protein